jgi:signal transduction histidine kinase
MRYSKTLKRTMLYLAKATPTGYVRMAYPMRAIRSKFVRFWLQALPIFTVALGLAYWLTLHISRNVSNDVRRINDGLEHLLAKRYDRAAPPVACCQELHTISKQIARIATKLEKRDRQKSKYTKRLKRLTRQQSEIISAISHEFKNPVAAIIGYAQTIQDDPDLPPGLRQKFLTKIIQNGERITDLIDRLALAIKMDTHTLTLDKKPFDMAPLIEEAVDAQRKKYPNRTLQIETEPTEVTGDRMLFWYAVSNLIDNALKYSDATVVVRLHAGHFAVTDRGAGIPPHLQKKITQRFFRASSHAWDNSLGVGLFIVTYILRLHGLALQIESLPGSGSTFGFDLDAIRADDTHSV